MMVPPHRLKTLIGYSNSYQRDNCLCHNISQGTESLFEDHVCDRSRFPSVTTHVFEEHADEVWFLAFSHNGKMLASASKDAHAIIWDVEVH